MISVDDLINKILLTDIVTIILQIDYINRRPKKHKLLNVTDIVTMILQLGSEHIDK